MFIFRKIFLFLSLCLMGQSLWAELSVIDFKGIERVITDQLLREANPRKGFWWYKSNLIENIYRYYLPDRTDEDPVYRLVRELFFLNNDNINFGPVNNPTAIATYFTPRAIGRLMGAIQCARLTGHCSEGHLKKAIIHILSSDHQSAAAAEAASESSLTLPRAEIKASLATYIECCKADVVARKAAEAAKPESERQVIKDFRTDKTSFDKMVSTFAHWLQQAVERDEKAQQAIKKDSTVQQYFVTFAPERLLTGFLCAKAVDRDWLNEYFAGFFEYIAHQHGSDKALKKAVKDRSVALSMPPEFQTNFVLLDPADRFVRADYEVCKFTEDVAQCEAVLADPEARLLAQFGCDYFEQRAPEKIRYDVIEYDGVRFNTCVEIALLNFISTLIYNSETRQFDKRLLAALKPSAGLRDFFEIYKRPEDLQAGTARIDFAELVENIDGVIYFKTGESGKKCELDGDNSKENLERVLAAITGCPTFENAAAAISETGIKKVVIKPFDEANSLLYYSVSKSGGEDGLEYRLEFKRHVDIFFPYVRNSLSRSVSRLCTLQNSALQAKTDEDYIRAAMVDFSAIFDFYAVKKYTFLDDSLVYALMLVRNGITKQGSMSLHKSIDLLNQLIQTDVSAARESLDKLIIQAVINQYESITDDFEVLERFFTMVLSESNWTGTHLISRRALMPIISLEKFQKSYYAQAAVVSYWLRWPLDRFSADQLESVDQCVRKFFNIHVTPLKNVKVTHNVLLNLLNCISTGRFESHPDKDLVHAWVLQALEFLASKNDEVGELFCVIFRHTRLIEIPGLIYACNKILSDSSDHYPLDKTLHVLDSLDKTLELLIPGLEVIRQKTVNNFYKEYLNRPVPDRYEYLYNPDQFYNFDLDRRVGYLIKKVQTAAQEAAKKRVAKLRIQQIAEVRADELAARDLAGY